MKQVPQRNDRKWIDYAEATAEEVAAARQEIRQLLLDATTRHTPDYFAKLRARLGWPLGL